MKSVVLSTHFGFPIDIPRLTSNECGTVFTTNTNDAGLYLFPTVQPGQYRIAARRERFKQTEVTRLTVNVGDHIENKCKLEVGSLQEAVTAMSKRLNSSGVSIIKSGRCQRCPCNPCWESYPRVVA